MHGDELRCTMVISYNTKHEGIGLVEFDCLEKAASVLDRFSPARPSACKFLRPFDEWFTSVKIGCENGCVTRLCGVVPVFGAADNVCFAGQGHSTAEKQVRENVERSGLCLFFILRIHKLCQPSFRIFLDGNYLHLCLGASGIKEMLWRGVSFWELFSVCLLANLQLRTSDRS